MNVLKRVICALLLVCLAASPLTTFARDVFPNSMRILDDDSNGRYQHLATDDEIDYANERTFPTRLEGMDIQGEFPSRFTSSFSPSYYIINERVDEVINLLISDAIRVRAREITFSYEIERTERIASILIYAYVESVISRTLVRSINLRPATGDFLTIRDVMDVDIVPLAQRLLADRMRQLPEHYYAAQTVSLPDQAFYVNSRGITILFDEFQLSAMVGDVRRLQIRTRNIRTITIESVQTWLGGDYDLLMVPLRDVVEGLGYTVRWIPETRTAEILCSPLEAGGHVLAWVIVGENEYFTPVMHRSLESAPYLIDGNTYVPLSFFDQILTHTIYNIDSYDNITFMAYLR